MVAGFRGANLNHKRLETMNAEAVKTIELGRYRIDIFNDTDASNPFKDWDGCVPLMIEGGRDYGTHDYGDVEASILAALNNLDAAQLEALAVTLDGGADMIAAAKDNAEQYPERGTDSFRGHLADEIAEGLPSSGNDKLEYLEAIADALGLPCLNTCSSGPCQGDYVDIMAVWPKAWGKENRPKATPEQIAKELQAAVDLFGAWAWGDVYGYVVTDTVTDDEVGSCWGYYGTDHEKSGLLEAAGSEAAYAERTERQRHATRLKNWIRNHVPLTVREPFAHA